MKVFVCFGRTPYEGRSEPRIVFSQETSAARWCKEQESRRSRDWDYYDWEEMEVQE